MSTEVSTRWSIPEVKAQIAGLIAGLTGHGQPTTLVYGVQMRLGLTALQLISEAFDAKSAHGTGEDGIQWAELAPATIANRRLGPEDVGMLKGLGITKRKHGYGIRPNGGELDVTGRLMRPFLTDAQNKRWKLLFARKKAHLQGKFGMEDGAAAGMAAASAWATLKTEGALTKLDVLGSRVVAILKDTGRLAASLSPGIEEPEKFPLDAPPPPPMMMPNSKEGDRILRTEQGAVIVGTAVEYASRCHAKRPFWPQSLPAAWSQELARVCGAAVSEAIAIMASQQAA